MWPPIISQDRGLSPRSASIGRIIRSYVDGTVLLQPGCSIYSTHSTTRKRAHRPIRGRNIVPGNLISPTFNSVQDRRYLYRGVIVRRKKTVGWIKDEQQWLIWLFWKKPKIKKFITFKTCRFVYLNHVSRSLNISVGVLLYDLSRTKKTLHGQARI